MKLEVGKRYVRRDGEITGKLTYDGHAVYPFTCPEYEHDYTLDGYYWTSRQVEPEDIISECIEPPPSDPINELASNPPVEDLTRLRDEFAMAASMQEIEALIGDKVTSVSKFIGIDPATYDAGTHYAQACAKAKYIISDAMLAARSAPK